MEQTIIRRMISIKNLLNKIKWDPREQPEGYVIVYYDRLEKKLKELPYTEIKKVEEGFLLLEGNGEEVNIPLHRIRQVKKKGRVVWERKGEK